MQFETMQMQVLSNMITAVTIVAFYLSSLYIKRVKRSLTKIQFKPRIKLNYNK